MPDAPHQSKVKLVDAAIDTVRAKGYNATRVEDVCAAAGVTKGSFFHHFASKDELALAAAAAWDGRAHDLFSAAAGPDGADADPLDRLFAYIDYRRAMLDGDVLSASCFGGTVIQETWATHPALAGACADSIFTHADGLAAIIAEAMRKHDVASNWTADGLARHMMAIVQGALLLAKAEGSNAIAAESLAHLRRYVGFLFGRTSLSAEQAPSQP